MISQVAEWMSGMMTGRGFRVRISGSPAEGSRAFRQSLQENVGIVP
jgi:hypothetical protein